MKLKTNNRKNQAVVKHSQTVRQSLNFQTTEAVYGLELSCPDTKADIIATTARAEILVEAHLNKKCREHRKLLMALAEERQSAKSK